jgi:hypothetical protein
MEQDHPPRLIETAIAGTAPPIARTPMAPRPWGRLGLLAWMFRSEPPLRDVDGPARGAGRRRRFVLLALSLAPALYATYVMAACCPTIRRRGPTGTAAVLRCSRAGSPASGRRSWVSSCCCAAATGT